MTAMIVGGGGVRRTSPISMYHCRLCLLATYSRTQAQCKSTNTGAKTKDGKNICAKGITIQKKMVSRASEIVERRVGRGNVS